MATDTAQQLYDALKRISRYRSPEYIKRNPHIWGLHDGNEALEMAYENILWEARAVIKGKRRPSGRRER